MIRAGRERLHGRVEVDEAYVGAQKEGARGRGAEGKTLVLVAVEGGEMEKLGRVRFRCVSAINGDTVDSFVTDYVENLAQSWLQTDCRSMTILGASVLTIVLIS